jgi:hypothetical protein
MRQLHSRNLNSKALIAASTILCMPAYSNSAPSMDIEIDPADFIMGGYRIHAGYVRLPLRYDIGIIGVEIPSTFHGNDDFTYDLFGVIGRVDYLFDSYDNFFVGVECTQMRNRYTHKSTQSSVTRYPLLLATRIGYRFQFFEHLTVTPWVGLGVLLNKGEDFVVDADKFKTPTFNAFPTIHLGWAF